MLEAAHTDDRKKILVIDDLAEQGALARAVLEDHGFDVEVAQDARLGLKLLSRKPDLMILDLGVEAYRFIEHARELTSTPPVVFLSGTRGIETLLRGVALGAFTFLPKPVNFTALVATCRAALNRPSPDGSRPADERRAHPRHPFTVPVRLLREGAAGGAGSATDTPRSFARGQLTDISAGGARVFSTSRLYRGTRVQLMPDAGVVHAPNDLQALVRASDADARGFSHGLEFVDLDPEIARLLKAHLTSQ